MEIQFSSTPSIRNNNYGAIFLLIGVSAISVLAIAGYVHYSNKLKKQKDDYEAEN